MSDNHIVGVDKKIWGNNAGKPFAGHIIETIVALPEIDTAIKFEDFMLEADCFGDTDNVKISLPCWGVMLGELPAMIWGRFLLWPDDNPAFYDGLVFCAGVSMWLDCPELNISKHKGLH